MSESTTHLNRLQRLACTADARTHAQHAAIHGEDFTTNPYPVGSYFWCVWCATYEDTIQHLVNAEAERHEAELAERCVRDGEICNGEELADAAEVQPVSFIQKLLDRFFHTKGV